MEVDGITDSDLSFNKKSEVSLIYDLQVFAWYFKKESTYSDKLAEMQLKPDTIGVSGGDFSKNLCILGSILGIIYPSMHPWVREIKDCANICPREKVQNQKKEKFF